jgi:hypothetical protein
MLRGAQYVQLLYVAAKLRIAERLESTGPLTPGKLADAVGADARVLKRVMDGLVVCGILVHHRGGRFGLSPVGRQLAHPGLREWAVFTGEVQCSAWSRLYLLVKGGDGTIDCSFGESVFDHLQDKPRQLARFYDITAQPAEVHEAFMRKMRFDGAATLIDLGGGDGRFACDVAAARKALRCTVLETGRAVTLARKRIRETGLSSRCDAVKGDLMKSLPKGHDIYVLKSVLHDWPDTNYLQIMTQCRRAMYTHSRLYIIERIVPSRKPVTPEWVDTDLHLLVLTGGKERTRKEHARLIAQSGLHLVAVRRVAEGWCVVEVAKGGR